MQQLEVVDRNAAVDVEHRTIGPVGLVGSEVDGRMYDVFGLSKAPAWLAAEPDGARCLIIQQPFGHQRRFNGARADGVGAVAFWPELHRETPSQRDHGAFGGGVRVLRNRAAHERDERRNVDDGPFSLAHHARVTCLHLRKMPRALMFITWSQTSTGVSMTE